MGRAKYSQDKRKTIVAAFVSAAIDIIAEEGVDAVSIRKVSSRTGYSSATLYLYFDDLAELVSLASVSCLKEYVSEIANEKDFPTVPLDAYRHTWSVFCRYAFAEAPAFARLFFGPGHDSLDEVVKEYFAIFPNELDNVSGPMLSMLLAGDLHDRNMEVLAPVAKELGFSDHDTRLINDLTISYFRQFLDQACENPPDGNAQEAMIKSFLEGAFFLLGKDTEGNPLP